MKVIFLDIDGVLNCSNPFEIFIWKIKRKFKIKSNHKIIEIEKKFVRKLNWLVKKSGTNIVISSTWRNTFPRFIQWVYVFTFLGYYRVGEAVIGRTCRHKAGVMRGEEIDLWINTPSLREDDYSQEEAVDNYVILDDDSDMLESQKDNFIRINNKYGLTWKNCKEALKILKGEKYGKDKF